MLNAALQPVAYTDERDSSRYRLMATAMGRSRSAGELPITLHNVSETGLLIEAETSLQVGSFILIALSGEAEVSAKVVWSSGAYHGAQFDRPMSPSFVRACLADSRIVWPWATDRANDRGVPLAFSTEPVRLDSPAQELADTSTLSPALRVQILLLISIVLWYGLGKATLQLFS